MESWINLVPDCRKALAWLALYQNLFKKAFTCIYFLNKNSFFLVCPSLSLRCWLPLLACPTSAFYLSCYVFLKQYYSMHNADNDTILHLFLIKNKYVTLPLFAPSKIPTISYLKKKKYRRRDWGAASSKSSSRQTAHWKCNTLHRVTGQLANGNLNFKRNMNKILFYFENELSALHHESNICLNLLCSWSLRLLAESFDSWS